MTAAEVKKSIVRDLDLLGDETLIDVADYIKKMVMREYIRRYGIDSVPLSPKLQWLSNSGSVNISDEEFDEMRYEYLSKKYQ